MVLQPTRHFNCLRELPSYNFPVKAGSTTYKVYTVTLYSGTVHEIDYTPNSDGDALFLK